MADPILAPRNTPARVPASEAPRPEGLLGLAVAVVIVAALYFGREVLIPITLAVLLSFVLGPLVNLLHRIRVPKIPAVLLAVVIALAVILMLGTLIGTQIASLAQDVPKYQSTIEQKISTVRGFTVTRMNDVMARVGRAERNAAPPAAPPEAPQASTEPKPTPVTIVEQTPSPLTLLQRFLSPILSPIETLGIVFVVAIFILMQQEDLRNRMIRLFGSNDLHRTTMALDDAAQRLSRYFLTQLAVNASFGTIVGVGLFFIGVPSPVLWGVLGAMLRFVPYVGSFIAAVLPLALAAAVEPGWGMLIWTAVLFVVTEGLVGQVVEPLLYGHSTGLSPVAVIVVAIFWSWIWGPIGLILSTPLTLCLVVLGRHVERLEFLDIALGDRPALTPVESFYQRTLADDQDEILNQAETLLKSRSLSSYYDDVALKGLQLAAVDVQRGVLKEHEVERLNAAVQELVHELDVYEDTDPAIAKPDEGVAGTSREDRKVTTSQAPAMSAPPELAPAWRGPAPVLCIAGRGALDEAASTMLAQLLGKHGLGANILPHKAVSRSGVSSIDLTGVAMICISYLDLSGPQTRLRYLVRRLRQRAPDLPLLVGLWPIDDEILTDEAVRQQLGADHFVTSLSQTVTTCVDASRAAAEGKPTLSIVPEATSQTN